MLTPAGGQERNGMITYWTGSHVCSRFGNGHRAPEPGGDVTERHDRSPQAEADSR